MISSVAFLFHNTFASFADRAVLNELWDGLLTCTPFQIQSAGIKKKLLPAFVHETFANSFVTVYSPFAEVVVTAKSAIELQTLAGRAAARRLQQKELRPKLPRAFGSRHLP